MIEDEVKPALTAEEWAARRLTLITGIDVDVQDEAMVIEMRDGDLCLRDYQRHRLAAFALHGQPFGFTWEDVKALRDLMRSDTDSLASRIEALLPPEPKE